MYFVVLWGNFGCPYVDKNVSMEVIRFSALAETIFLIRVEPHKLNQAKAQADTGIVPMASPSSSSWIEQVCGKQHNFYDPRCPLLKSEFFFFWICIFSLGK